MRLALECPTELLEYIQPLADFDWILAHKVLNDDDYASFYQKSMRYKVLDNSVHELREPMTLDELQRAADIVNPNLIVAPDHLDNHFATIDSLEKATKVFGLEKIMPVVQGHEHRYVLECFDYIKQMGFKRVAIPAYKASSNEIMTQKRKNILDSLFSRVPAGFEFHLLGMTTLEELETCDKFWIKSIDTGVPVLCGLKGIRFDYDKLPVKGITMNQFDSSSYSYELEMVYYNIAYMRKLLNGTR